MSRFVNRKGIFSILVILTLIIAFAGGIVFRGGATRAVHAASNQTTKSVFCAKLGKTLQASAGAQMYCFGAQANGTAAHSLNTTTKSFGPNVNAANPSEDVAPNGVRAYGQSETSIGASGRYAVEAWNDSTAFFATCGAPQNKDQATGFGFSADNGASFTDLGGLPNADCNNTRYDGDPSVEAWNTGGKTYFYVSSLFNPINGTTDQRSHIAMAACVASGKGLTAALKCSQPINMASSSECATIPGNPTFCSLLDKSFLSIDRAHGLLYMSYTEFGFTADLSASTDIIELAVCDIGNGALGGTPAKPVCTNGSTGSALAPVAPYMVVADTDPAGCENEGAYPAVDPARGDVYVTYEHNWASALFGCVPGPQSPVQNVMNFIPASCLTLPTASCGPAATNAVNITSLQGAFTPGYNRFPMNDFPRIAVSDATSTVSMVWNDGRYNVGGDILMQSMNLTTLGKTSAAPVALNKVRGGWNFLPALRNVNPQGQLNVSWYSRSSANTAITDVTAALDVNARSTATPSNLRVTTVSSDWNSISSDIVPNFGDYTDNYTVNTGNNTPGSQNYAAWSDGRLGVPQPFASSAQS